MCRWGFPHIRNILPPLATNIHVIEFPGARNLALLMSQGFTEAESRWALVIVDTRAFTFQSGTEQECLALVPLLDLFNNRHLGRLLNKCTQRESVDSGSKCAG